MFDFRLIKSANDKDNITDFLKIVERLKKSKLLRPKQFPVKYELTFTDVRGQGRVVTTISQPKESTLATSLYDVRKLCADGAYTQLSKMYGILGKIIVDESKRETIKKMKKAYNDSLKAESVSIRVFHEKGMSPKKALDLYFNGVYFHEERAKRKELLEDFESSQPKVRVLFLIAVRNIIMHSILCRNFIHQNFSHLD